MKRKQRLANLKRKLKVFFMILVLLDSLSISEDSLLTSLIYIYSKNLSDFRSHYIIDFNFLIVVFLK